MYMSDIHYIAREINVRVKKTSNSIGIISIFPFEKCVRIEDIEGEIFIE